MKVPDMSLNSGRWWETSALYPYFRKAGLVTSVFITARIASIFVSRSSHV